MRSAPVFAITTKSQQGNDCCMRKASLARRFSLFLSTALLAARREIVNPSRAIGRAFGLPRIVKKRSLERAGSAKTRPNSFEVCRRCSGENPAGLPGNVAPNPSPLGRQASATLCTPACENFATGARGHARAKAVGTLAMQIAGLKSAFHACVPGMARVLGKTKGCRSVRERRTVRGVHWSVNTAELCARSGLRVRRVLVKLWIKGTRND